MKKVDIDSVQRIIAEVAAEEIMPRYRKLAAGDIEMKAANDPVTIADKAAEKRLIERLTLELPGSVVVGEESFAEDPGILSRFEGNEAVWVIDPIDGTRNFVEGVPEFGVMVALVQNLDTVAAWIHDPNTGDTLQGEVGAGVWLSGHKMRLAARDPSQMQLGIIGSRLKKLLSKPEGVEILKSLPKLETGSAAAFDYGRLFSGDVLFAKSSAPRASFLLYRQSKPWDHVPGLFLHAETGGYAADFAGKPYNMQKSLEGLLLAPDFEAWQGFIRVFQPFIRNMGIS